MSPSSPRRRRSFETYLALGVAIGVAVGIVLDHLALGIAIGTAIGVALGESEKRRDRGGGNEE